MSVVFQRIDTIPLTDLIPFPGNARRGDIEAIRASLRTHGQYRALVVREHDGVLTILAGNQTHMALAAEAQTMARCEIITCDDVTARKINVADNRLNELGGNDDQALAELLAALDGDYEGTGYDPQDIDALADLLNGLSGTGYGDGADGGTGSPLDTVSRPSLADRFLIPPFDVLDARQGWWRTRKRQWIDLGLRSEIGRDGGLVFAGNARRDPDYYTTKTRVEQRLGRKLTTAEFDAEHYEVPDTTYTSGTSVFDPVLCELAYRWFSPRGGLVLDPFAGGSVRGLVAGILGRRYLGNDLAAEQVAENRQQAAAFTERGLLATNAPSPNATEEEPIAQESLAPRWTVGDSQEWVTTLEPESSDLIFTCPPYYNLERYSDDPVDLSTMGYEAFDIAFTTILIGAVKALRAHRFAVIVTGDARDGRGTLHDLRGATIKAAQRAGLAFCSGAVLVTSAGSLPRLAPRAFTATRTLGRSHQDVLVFVKGDRKAATEACGPVDVHIPEELEAAFAAGGEFGDSP